ncbi:unnamed protein product [Rangifer tarandus platyrhynchus]|uniref:Uncharacterized protein n=2 Tax=Rangifer tarandus platyrhynchus TaxID=3082113 RepID=A0ABN8Z620_RANTA|nr:unnamed protein product [Rangifer tarandus platyrhynchus]
MTHCVTGSMYLLVISHICPDVFLTLKSQKYPRDPSSLLYVHIAGPLPHPNLQYGAQRKGSGAAEPGDRWGGRPLGLCVEAKQCPLGGLGGPGGVGLLRASFVPLGLGLLSSPCSCEETGVCGSTETCTWAPPT